jgi:hypothetical protein
VTDTVIEREVVRGPFGLWLALLAGPAGASLQLSVNYALVKWACAAGASWVLATLALVFLAMAVAGLVLGATHLVSVEGDHPAGRTWSAQSRRLLAAVAIGVDSLVAIFLINTLIAIATLSPCE